MTDTSGRSTLPRLFAIGETSCTGVHGANRLASNSLLEALVFAHRAAETLEEGLQRLQPLPRPSSLPEPGTAPVEAVLLVHDREEVRSLMWDLVGIVRTDERLALARGRMEEIAVQYERLWRRCEPSPELIELRNLVQTALLIIRSAQSRKESRGLHFNLDYPYRDNERSLHDTILARGVGAP